MPLGAWRRVPDRVTSPAAVVSTVVVPLVAPAGRGVLAPAVVRGGACASAVGLAQVPGRTPAPVRPAAAAAAAPGPCAAGHGGPRCGGRARGGRAGARGRAGGAAARPGRRAAAAARAGGGRGGGRGGAGAARGAGAGPVDERALSRRRPGRRAAHHGRALAAGARRRTDPHRDVVRRARAHGGDAAAAHRAARAAAAPCGAVGRGGWPRRGRPAAASDGGVDRGDGRLPGGRAVRGAVRLRRGVPAGVGVEHAEPAGADRRGRGVRGVGRVRPSAAGGGPAGRTPPRPPSSAGPTGAAG
ncbi:hypothetical protein M2169_002408 [Streptomyces sp. MJP52]|nr:hypothetical protein [Streptomyces sp. MJP52]